MAGRILKLTPLIGLVLAIAAFYISARLIFPLKYGSQIASAAEEFGLDKSLIQAVIWTESKYDDKAVSVVGAEGLMQLMPSTRSWIAEESGIPSTSDIRLGCWYLRYLFSIFSNEDDVLMSYNAGQGTVERWKQSGEQPYKETADYVKRVRLARRVYAHLL